jgi:DMSO/TMAO reductase YedYZ molybdopterin-dependent catalytic subunit
MKNIELSRKQRFRSGMLVGLVAGIIASALMLLLSVTLDGISLPEVVGGALTQLMPASVFDYLHQLIGGDAKHYFFYIILAGQCLIFALAGGLSNLALPLPQLASLRNEQGQWLWPAGALLALLLWLLTGLVLLPATGAGIFGSQLTIGVFNTITSLAIDGLAFGLVFVLFQNWLVVRHLRAQETVSEDSLQQADETRRLILRRGIAVVGLGTLGALAWRFIVGTGGAITAPVTGVIPKVKSKIIPPPKPRYGDVVSVPNLSSEITPNNQYYVVSKNLVSDPTVDAKAWQLQIAGEIEKPYTLTYDELMALPRKQQYESMMCISNEVGGPYMSNALWEGVPLVDLLSQAGKITKGATKVVLHAADDYADSIHLSKALEPTTMVALRMNGVTLPQGHGFPARLLVPGIYGMKHVKWMTAIEVVNTDYQGYWQQRGWSDPAPIRMTSRIDTPLTGTTLKANKPTYIAGVAFSGNKGISEVDVSLDGGKTWSVATLKQPHSDLTWVLWELPWQPAAGNYTLVVHAVDLEGNVQDPEPASPAPDGSSGYHTITVTVQ